jgi:hypothetical protein
MVERGGPRRGFRLLTVGLGLIVIGLSVMGGLLLFNRPEGIDSPWPARPSPTPTAPQGTSAPPTQSSSPPQGTSAPPTQSSPPPPTPTETVEPVDYAGLAGLLTSVAGVITATTGLVFALKQRPPNANVVSKES